MEDRKNIEKMERYQQQLKELFHELADTETYDTWAETFEIVGVDKKRVTIAYCGVKKTKKFKKACKKTLTSCVSSLMGEGMKIKITKKKNYKELPPKTQKNIRALRFFVAGMIFVCFATAIAVITGNYIGNRNFRETFYNVSTIKADNRLRVIQISDLHKTSYGENNERLIERIRELKPDIIICTGDIVESAKDDIDYAVNLGENLAKIAPSYYVYGNNEVASIYDFVLSENELDKKFKFNESNRDETALLKIKDTFEEKLEKTGIKVLKNEKDTIEVKNMKIDVYGVLTSNPSSFWSYSEKAFLNYTYENPDNIKITAIHEPFIFEEFQHDFWGDLMVCGHTHGGVVRVPVLGPLYTNEGGLFPERNGAFVYGRYNTAGKPLVVSSGLENKDVFRINNQPELVIIDINKF